jgi:hypothetical protein
VARDAEAPQSRRLRLVAQRAVSLDVLRANDNVPQFNLLVGDLCAAAWAITATVAACATRVVAVHEVFMRYGENICALVDPSILLVEVPHSFGVSEHE